MSPDARFLANLVVTTDPQHPDDIDASIAVIGVTDLATGQVRRIWEHPGGRVGESAVGWSPDGQLIAATYDSMDEQHTSVVVTPTGTVVAHLDYTCLVPPSSTAWLADRQLLCTVEAGLTSGMIILDVDSGTRRVPGKVNSYPHLRLGDRLVITSPHEIEGWQTYDTIGLDGTQRQPWLLVTPVTTVLLYQRSAMST
ncbi:MAG: hypothetical protein JXA67_18540 [Micromonosporaceae bacterium]|nr:hypothetical protein [Micromonosporaceae bacterium]